MMVKYKEKNNKRLQLCLWLAGLLLLVELLVPGTAVAQSKAEAQEYLTKGDAVMLLSASDFMKKKMGELLSWTVGYDVSKVNRVKLTPTINYVLAVPKRIPPDGRTILEVSASVSDPGGLRNIAGVRADLVQIGRLSNTMLVDNGLFGDRKAKDGVYTVQTNVNPQVPLGAKEIPVAVANKKGWLAYAKTSLDVLRNPVIIEALVDPPRVRADGASMVTITVKIDNPGRNEDIQAVTASSPVFGGAGTVNFRNDGLGGDVVAGDDVFALQFIVPGSVKEGEYKIKIEVTNLAGGYTASDIDLSVFK